MSTTDKEKILTENTTTPHKKRGRKPGKTRKGYFYEEQEQAFLDYVSSTDKLYRDRLFADKLYPAFTKMIESIIRRYELFTPTEDFSDTFNDTMSFLITKVNNYDVSKGAKVYSYCGTICKNYLILKRTQYMKKRDKMISYDNNPISEVVPTKKISTPDPLFLNFHGDLIAQTVAEIKKMLEPDYNGYMTKNEISVGYALIELLTNWEEIFKHIETHKFNKTSVYFFIKEMTMLSTKEVRDAMRKFKCLYNVTKQKLIKD